MAATLGGTMRSPFTAILFTLELTHEFDMMFPVMMAVFASYGLTTLVMKRSILTEKVSRRGFHVSREYSIDPLEIIFAREVMRTNLVVLPPTLDADARAALDHIGLMRQRLFPVVDGGGRLLGVVRADDVPRLLAERTAETLPPWVNRAPVVARADEPLRVVANRMAEHGITRMPVVAPDDPQRLMGMISLRELLQARARNLTDERHRERTLRVRFLPRIRATDAA
jgi:CBS domain-containing protein